MNIQFIILINVWRFMEPEYHRVNISIYLNIPINSGWLMFEICNYSGIQMGSMSSFDWNNLKPFTLIEGEAPAAGIAQWFVARPLIGTMCEVCVETNVISSIFIWGVLNWRLFLTGPWVDWWFYLLSKGEYDIPSSKLICLNNGDTTNKGDITKHRQMWLRFMPIKPGFGIPLPGWCCNGTFHQPCVLGLVETYNLMVTDHLGNGEDELVHKYDKSDELRRGDSISTLGKSSSWELVERFAKDSHGFAFLSPFPCVSV